MKVVRYLLPACLALTVALAAPPRRKVIIDQDALGPGGSNMGALLLIIQAPDVEVLGITIESGDGWMKENVAHTLRMLELVGRTDIPVFAGVTLPLLNTEKGTAAWEARYGKLHYKGAWNDSPTKPYHPADAIPPLIEGEPVTKAAPEPAVQFLVRKVREFPGQVSIVALGPLTNLALACKLDDQFAAQAEQIVAMAGSLNPQGHFGDSFDREFKHTPRLEFNLRWDPEAARIVLHSPWKAITFLTVDASTANRSGPSLIAQVRPLHTPASEYLVKYFKRPMPMWDELAAAIWLQPALIQHAERLAIDVETSPGAEYGILQSWDAGKGPGLGEPDATVVRSIDIPAFEKLYLANLGQQPIPAK